MGQRHYSGMGLFNRLSGWIGLHAMEIVLGFFILLPAVMALGYFLPPINHDAAANLDFARRWLLGEQLYVDLIDINTPLVFVIFSLPALLAEATGISIPTALTAFFTLCLVGSIYSCHILLRDYVARGRPLLHALSLLMTLFVLIVFPGENYGQREHLMMIAAVPYVLLAVTRLENQAVSRIFALSIAFCAALAFGQKPHFMPILALLEGYILMQRGWRAALRDPVPWLVLAVLLTYLLAVLIFLPALVNTILPLAADEYLKLGEGSIFALIFDRVTGSTLVAIAILSICAFFGTRRHYDRLVALYAIGAAISNLAQEKGWPYHVMPSQAGIFLLIAIFMSEAVGRYLPRERAGYRLPVAAVTGTIMLFTYYAAFILEPPFQKQIEFHSSPTAALLKIIKRDVRDGRMLVFSPGIYPFYPLVLYARAQMVMPYQTMWLLQGLYHDCEDGAPLYREPADMPSIERKLFDDMSRILADRRPEVVIVDRVPGMPRCQEAVFDYLEYFLRNPVFAEAWKDYEFVTTYDRYNIYRRL